MNTAVRTIARNVGYLMGSQVVTWALSLALMLFLPRYLGAAGIGKYQLAGSIWSLMAILIGFGMDTLLTKEVARDPGRLSTLIFTSAVLRGALFAVGCVSVALYTHWADYPGETLQVIFIFGISTIVSQLASVCAASLQGLERMEYLSLSNIAGQTFTTVVGIVLLLLGYRVITLAVVFLGSALVTLLVRLVALGRIHQLRFSVDRHLFGWMLKASFPYLMVFGFLVAYNQVDVLIISLLLSEKQIGWYGAANGLFGTFLFIPTVFTAAIFPSLARMHKASPQSLAAVLSRSFDTLLLVGVPMGLGVLAIANPLVVFLYGPDFANSGPILMVLGLVLIFTYQNIILSQFFISSDRQNVWIVVMAVAAVATIPLDLVLVPWCQATFGIGALGGALSYLVTEAAMVVYGLFNLPRGMLGWSTAWRALRVAVAGLAMAAVAWWLHGLFIAIPVAVGVVVYCSAILLLRVITSEELVLARSLCQSGLDRVKRAGRATAGLAEEA